MRAAVEREAIDLEKAARNKILIMTEAAYPSMRLPDISGSYPKESEAFEETSYFSNRKFDEIRAMDFDTNQMVFEFCPRHFLSDLLGAYIFSTTSDEVFSTLAFDRSFASLGPQDAKRRIKSKIETIVDSLDAQKRELFREYLMVALVPLGDFHSLHAKRIIDIL